MLYCQRLSLAVLSNGTFDSPAVAESGVGGAQISVMPSSVRINRSESTVALESGEAAASAAGRRLTVRNMSAWRNDISVDGLTPD